MLGLAGSEDETGKDFVSDWAYHFHGEGPKGFGAQRFRSDGATGHSMYTFDSATDAVALIERARKHWRAEGYKVGEVLAPTSSNPRVHGERDDYGLIVDVNTEARHADVAGSTPCVEDQ